MSYESTMRKVNVNEIKEEASQSPRGKYVVYFKGISEALGREPSSLDLSRRHPFDLEWNRVPPGKANFPYHKNGRTEVAIGDAFIFGPDEPHELINTGEQDFVFYIVADNPIGESTYYPDSGKWIVNKSSAKDRVVIKGEETDYFDGEE